ncbi:MAG: ribosome biogenesis GTPase Der [Deltaproteobacteria bacterium]|nr:ribosome biogenesis GTPase Der [Deltaproteobacteria bacterium]
MSAIIAIVGRPNVGKSTLFNRLTRSRGALVDDFPGITRDRLYASLSFEGVPLTLVDTGGFDDLDRDPLVTKVKSQIEAAIEEADRVIFMVDGRQGLLPGDEAVAKLLRRSGKMSLLAVNKLDGPEHHHLTAEFFKLGLKAVYPISAAHGYGIRDLMEDIVRDIPAHQPESLEGGAVRVAVLGRPNSGKSSLINRILGLDRLVVSELPGTTRDTVDTPFEYHGRHYLLIDTAGIRRKAKVKEKIEKFSVIKAIKSLDRCHIAVVLLDAERGIAEQDARICGYALERGRGMVLAVNKWDLVKGDLRAGKHLDDQIARQLKFLSFVPRLNMSALTGERVMKLLPKIDQVYDQFSTRVQTSAVNTAIRQVMEKHPPPWTGRGRLKFLYATQVASRPPTFVLFVNRPEMIHFSYERFVVNELRARLGLELTTIRLKFKKRE